MNRRTTLSLTFAASCAALLITLSGLVLDQIPAAMAASISLTEQSIKLVRQHRLGHAAELQTSDRRHFTD